MMIVNRQCWKPTDESSFLSVFILKSNLLEASPEMMQRDSEKEWYYGNKEKERLGPFSFKEVSDTTYFKHCLVLHVHVLLLPTT